MATETIEIIVNGDPRRIPAHTTVAELLQLLDLADTRVAVERNRDVVTRARYAEVVLADGDRLEVVGFVGGG